MMKFDIEELDISSSARGYFASKESFEQAWQECPRSDWMIEIAHEVMVRLKVLYKALVLCALEAKWHMKDKRSVKACEVLLAFCEGRASQKEVYDASVEARKVTSSVRLPCLFYNATYTAASAAAILATAVAARNPGSYANVIRAYDAARLAASNRAKMADICREILAGEVFKRIKKTK